MEFIKKNFVTVLVIGATIVLAGVAMFTALRLYNLRQDPITPVAPEDSSASDAPIGIRPSSGSWNNPEMFIITNTSEESAEIAWSLDCTDENLCEDSSGTETILAGDSVEYGLGSICSEWQLQVNWSGTAIPGGDIWDWAGVAELSPDCDVELSDLTEELTEEEDAIIPSLEDTVITEPTTINTDIETVACSDFSFTLGAESEIGGFEETPAPSVIVTATPTAIAIATPIVTSVPTAKPTPVALPDAGVSAPTIFGITAGAALLFISLALAL